MTRFAGRETLGDIAILNAATRASQLESGLKDAGLQLLAHERSLVTQALNDEWVEGTKANYLRVRGTVLAWILATPDAVSLLPKRRLRVRYVAVEGGLDLTDARTKCGLRLEHAAVSGPLTLTDAALGPVSISDSKIGDGALEDLLGEGASFDGPLDLSALKARHVNLKYTNIAGSLILSGAKLKAHQKVSLNADGARVQGNVLIKGATFEGEVRLVSATIAGQFQCQASEFHDALTIDFARIGAGVFLNTEPEGLARTEFRSQVSMIDAAITGPLTCKGSSFLQNPSGVALHADGAEISGSVHLGSGARFEGCVRFVHATIGRTLGCHGSTFANRGGEALIAYGARIGGDFLVVKYDDEGTERDSASFEGKLVLTAVAVGGTLELDPSSVAPEDRAVREPGDESLDPYCIDLSHADIGLLTFWSVPGRDVPIWLEGAVYRRIVSQVDEKGLTDALLDEWAERPVSAQTYEQMAAWLRASGESETADNVMVARHEHSRKRIPTGWRTAPRRTLLLVFRSTMKYGYAPLRLLVVAACLAVIGSALTFAAIHKAAMTAPEDVNIFVGSLATGFGRLFPFGAGVEPGTVNTGGFWPCVLYNVAWGWYWLEGITGWFLAGIGAVGLTNLVRKV